MPSLLSAVPGVCIPGLQLKECPENTFCSLWCFLSVTQTKAEQLWDEDNIPPQSERLHLSPLCVRGRACVFWTAVKWLVECQQCASACPTMRFNGSWINATYCVCVCVRGVCAPVWACVRVAVDRCVFFFSPPSLC